MGAGLRAEILRPEGRRLQFHAFGRSAESAWTPAHVAVCRRVPDFGKLPMATNCPLCRVPAGGTAGDGN
jgi:hypothetical protein